MSKYCIIVNSDCPYKKDLFCNYKNDGISDPTCGCLAEIVKFDVWNFISKISIKKIGKDVSIGFIEFCNMDEDGIQTIGIHKNYFVGYSKYIDQIEFLPEEEVLKFETKDLSKNFGYEIGRICINILKEIEKGNSF